MNQKNHPGIHTEKKSVTHSLLKYSMTISMATSLLTAQIAPLGLFITTSLTHSASALAQDEFDGDFPPPPPSEFDIPPPPITGNSGGSNTSNPGFAGGYRSKVNKDKDGGILNRNQKKKFSDASIEDITDKNFPETIESFDFPNADIQDIVKAISSDR